MDNDKHTRRRFLEKVLIGAGSFATVFFGATFDSRDGVKIGGASLKIGVPEAHATCGMSYECSGGSGQCGMSYECSGGGGACGMSYNCSGGGGQCGMAYNCAGQ